MEQNTGEAKTVYEVSFLLLPSLAAEQVPQEAASIKEAITSRGGDIISSEEPVMIDLAYPITKVVGTDRHKVATGFFGWVKFELAADGVGDLKKALDGMESVVRYLIIKTVRENTLLHGKMKLKAEEKPRAEEKEEESAPRSLDEAAELDKSIDELVQ